MSEKPIDINKKEEPKGILDQYDWEDTAFLTSFVDQMIANKARIDHIITPKSTAQDDISRRQLGV